MRAYKIVISNEVLNKDLFDLQPFHAELAARFGGFNLIEGTGFWCEDASKTRKVYTKPSEERSLSYFVTIDSDQHSELISIVVGNLPTDLIKWVHIEYNEVQTNHVNLLA